jgi:UDP-N-acetylglucosamine--N-acetylmuramyl-(pentapeptide) pyrophosphoryl-undecaprenol N-acetylglucosamine transferase
MTDHNPEATLHFVGNVGGFERPLIQRSQISFDSHDEVLAGPVHGVNPLRLLASVGKLAVGTLQALRLLRKRRPHVVLSTGGWVSLPVALAAWVQRVPLVIYLPDIEPGLTIKALRPFATRVAITVPESATYFREGQTVVTGYPLRSELLEATRDAGLAHFNLDPDRPVVLVFGGSRGARAINIALGNILKHLLEAGIQVIHVTGTLDWERMQQQVTDVVDHPDYRAYDYLDEMGLAFAAADLAVCRAGASILGEFPYFQLPSILIPLAYNWRYQQINADYLAQRGAAIHLDEHAMVQDLRSTIQTLISDPERLAAMRTRAAELARPDGAANIANMLVELARGDG